LALVIENVMPLTVLFCCTKRTLFSIASKLFASTTKNNSIAQEGSDVILTIVILAV
jgi:hypothetical protein